jgi:magnesium transporter
MNKKISKSTEKVGLPPGVSFFVGERKVEQIEITVMDYDKSSIDFRKVKNVKEIFPYKDSKTISWINIYGLHDQEILEKLGEHFEIHPLVLEDIANTQQRPKIEFLDKYVFFVLKMIWYEGDDDTLKFEQISVLMGRNIILCFQERPRDLFDSIRKRLQDPNGRLRKGEADYLAYRILDVVVDHYFLVLETIETKIEILEDEVFENPSSDSVHKINQLKQDLIFLRKSTWPLRELMASIDREESPFFQKSTYMYIRDVYDHVIHVVDAIDTYRDMLSGLLDVYMSSISNKMNEVMKVLTIIATIFIPLTFFAGIYGMNFEFMPELKWPFAYPFLLGLMIVVAFAMLVYFRRKKWI